MVKEDEAANVELNDAVDVVSSEPTPTEKVLAGTKAALERLRTPEACERLKRKEWRR